jgi:hypothetical protein
MGIAIKTLRLIVTAVALTTSHGVFAGNANPPIHPLCLWEQAEKDSSVDACNKRHATDPVSFKGDEYSSPDPEESALGQDTIRAKPLGRLNSGDEVFRVYSVLFQNKEWGDYVVIWHRGEPDGGKITVLRHGGYEAAGGISSAAVIPGKGIQVDVSFDTAWEGFDEGWLRMLGNPSAPPAVGVGASLYQLGVARILYPEGRDFPGERNGDAILISVEITPWTVLEGKSETCEQRKILTAAKRLPHIFTAKEFGKLIEKIRKCPDSDTAH